MARHLLNHRPHVRNRIRPKPDLARTLRPDRSAIAPVWAVAIGPRSPSHHATLSTYHVYLAQLLERYDFSLIEVPIMKGALSYRFGSFTNATLGQ